MNAADFDRLPPTQQLVLEVLAARHRLGEQVWPFPAIHGRALRGLEQAGLITLLNGVVEHTTRARFTDAGLKLVMRGNYQPPNGGIDRLRTALEAIADYAEPRADTVIGMESIAKTARRALESWPA